MKQTVCLMCGAQFATHLEYLRHSKYEHDAVYESVSLQRSLRPGDKVRMIRHAGSTAHEGAVGTYVGPSESDNYPLKVEFPGYPDAILLHPGEVVYIPEVTINEDPV